MKITYRYKKMGKRFMNKRKINSIVVIAIMLISLSVTAFSTVTAEGPKSIYGTLYIDDGIAPAGIEVKIVIVGDTFNKSTFDWNV